MSEEKTMVRIKKEDLKKLKIIKVENDLKTIGDAITLLLQEKKNG